MANSEPDDPKTWSIDRVVNEFCHNDTPCWTDPNAPSGSALIPDRHELEVIFRKNHIDGDTLLSLGDKELRDDLAIPSFGQRRAVSKIIYFLAERYTANQKVRSYLQKGLTTPEITQPRPSAFAQSPTYAQSTSEIQYSAEPYQAIAPHLFDSKLENTRTISHEAPGPLPRAASHQPLQSANPYFYPFGQQTPFPPTYNQSATFVDKNSQTSMHSGWRHPPKPVVGNQASNDQGYLDVLDASIDQDLNRRTKSPLQPALEPATEVNVRLQPKPIRRVAPTLVSAPRRTYLGLVPQSTEDTLRQTDDNRIEFMDKVSELPAVKLTVPSATQQQLQSPTPRSENSDNASSLDEYDLLLEKYPPLDTEAEHSDDYGPLGESGDEGAYDEETWAEIDAEHEEDSKRARVLSYEQVNQSIDEALKEFEEEWRDTSLPKAQIKAYNIWMSAAKQKSRQPPIRRFQGFIDHNRQRLIKLREAILRDTWSKPAEVKGQCPSLEATVHQILENEYFIQVLRNDMAPEKPEKKIKTEPRIRRDLQDDEESLGSDSDVELQDFVVESPANRHTPESDFNPILPEPSTPTEQPSPDVIDGHSADEADVDSEDSEDEIMSPKTKSRGAHTLSERRPGSRSVLHNAETDSDSDFDAGPRLPPTKFKDRGDSKQRAIDLTFSDEVSPTQGTHSTSDFEIKTPDLNPGSDSDTKEPATGTKASPTRVKLPVGPKRDPPSLNSVTGIRRLDWITVEGDSDHLRALRKIVYALERDEACHLQSFVVGLGNQKQPESTLQIKMLQNGLMSFHHHSGFVSGALKNDQRPAQLLAALFATYVCSRNLVNGTGPSEADLNTSFEQTTRGYENFFDQVKLALGVYLQYLEQTPGDKPVAKQADKRTNKKRKLSATGIDINSAEESITPDHISTTEDEDEEIQSNQAPHKKRKKTVTQSQEVLTQQRSDQQRVMERETRRRQMEAKLALIKNDSTAQYNINVEEPVVQLHPHIAGRVKPHQLDGIRFLWREIIDDPKHQGCLLAHTMGLGKTMQVISLLVSIAECIRSPDEKVRAYIPTHLKESRTLILCPPTLLENWFDELLMWTPNGLLGHIHKISSSKDVDQIKEWAENHGTLLLSYDLFRSLLSPPTSRPRVTPSKFKPEDIENWLLKAPSMVIADEAHRMKNAKSKLSAVTKKVKTLSRIALTGSPLNNHLEEYHTMIDWIAPGYLGTMVQFKSKYSEPIISGLYADSTAHERRLCLRKLHVLKKDVAPKVNRADISAIEGDLRPKTEFFLTITLTEAQRKAYDVYVNHVLATHNGERAHPTQAKLFGWLADLLLLCNHPSCFIAVCERRRAKLQSQMNTSEESDALGVELEEENAPSPDDQQFQDLFDPEIGRSWSDMTAMDAAAKTFDSALMWEAADDIPLDDIFLSYRTIIVKQIIEKATALGDKTLIFSHSIPSLDYLAHLLEKMGLAFHRIDGSTNMIQRQQATKVFNKTESEVMVFLISTKAGGLGLNLQGSNRVVLFDFNWNPMYEEQAVGRAYRLGQEKSVFVYRFRAGGTFEDVVNNKAVFKNQLFQRVVDKKNPERYAKRTIAEFLAPPKEVEKKDYGDCLGKDPDVLDPIIAQLPDVVLNIELTETFQREDDEKLTENELKEADEEADDEKLRRDNPLAWEKKWSEKQRALAVIQNLARSTPVQVPAGSQIGQPVNPTMKRVENASKQTGSLNVPNAVSFLAAAPPPQTTSTRILKPPAATLPQVDGAGNEEDTAIPISDGADSDAPGCKSQ